MASLQLPFKDRKFVFLLAAVIIVIGLEILSLTGIDIPMPYAPIVFGAFILAIGHEVLWHGIKALVKLNFSSINLLMTIAVIAAFYLGEYPEAAVVIVLYTLSETMESIGIISSKTALSELVNKAPKTAFVKSLQREVLIDKIEVGSVIQIKPGELVPMDGTIVAGDTAVDEAAITGEPIPHDKHPGDTVYAGTLNKHGFIEIETTRLSADTTFSRIVRLTFEAQKNKSETQKFIQQFSKVYTPIVMGLAVLVFAIPVLFNDQPADVWLKQAITLLVIACPCALVISTPIAVYAAIGNASARGILIKGGKYIEAIGKIKAIALDKTRTLTYGKPIVSDIIPLHVRDKEELLACAAGAELFSEHPLAEAIVEASRMEGFTPHKAHKFESIIGKGARAECLVCEDETVLIGKLDFIREHQPVTKQAEQIVEALANEGKTSVVISFGAGVAGILGLTDEIKPDSRDAIDALKALGITPVILTGDSERAGTYVASQLGIEEVYGDLLPEDKTQKISALLARYGKVAMVGDGINDAPALAQSTVGIAMGAAGSDTAIETANVALMTDKLHLIPYLVRLGRATFNRIRFNTIGAILIKLIFITLAFLGYSHLVLAIAADVGVTLIVIVLSLQLMKFK
jgi:Cd2+/Zn2+-exporting ATPase